MTSVPATSTNAIAGSGLELGCLNSSWIIDLKAGVYWFYFDELGDGRLQDSHPIELKPQFENRWSGRISAVAHYTDGKTSPLVVEVIWDGTTVSFRYENTRSGEIVINDIRTNFQIVGTWGYYGMSPSIASFDFDQDGRYTPSESMKFRSRYVDIAGSTYRFTTSLDGATLTLTPAVRRRTPSPFGRTIPSLNSEAVDLRKGTVLLDFWSMSCEPCLSDQPRLLLLHQTFPMMLIVGVTPDEGDSLETFLSVHKDVDWPIISDHGFGGDLQSFFDIDEFPTYVLMKDGEVLMKARLDEIMRVLSP